MQQITPLPQGAALLDDQDQHCINDALASSTSANTRRAYNQAGRRIVAVATPCRRRRSWWLRSWRSWPRKASRWPPSGSPNPPWRRSTGHQDPTDNEGVKKAAGLGDGFTGHSGRVGMAQDLAAAGVELPALMTAGRWKSSKMPARYTEGQAAGRGAVARYYQRRGG